MTTEPSPVVPAQTRLQLGQVTLCAVTSVNVAATIRALETCMRQIDFARCLLLTDALDAATPAGIEVIRIRRLTSSEAYSGFMLSHLVDHVQTSHCMIVQWDGHVRDAQQWRPDFLNFDYIGASWPQFDDGHDVGNGGFSLRSKRLMELCRAPSFRQHHPEDIAICRTNRSELEQQGIRFAPPSLADDFSAERAGNVQSSFGYHGIFLMPLALGIESFWNVYRDLDDLGTIRRDFYDIVKTVVRGKGGLRRAGRLILDRARLSLKGRR